MNIRSSCQLGLLAGFSIALASACGTGGLNFGSGGSTSSSGMGGSCADSDGDGVTACQADCNDSDATVYPGNTEICGDAKDNNCDKIIDEGCNGLGTFVSNTGNDSDPGTQAKPVLTIAVGIQHAKTIGNGVSVYVAGGHYPEDVTVVEGISLYGGHDPATWAHDPAKNDTAILAKTANGVLADATVTRKTVIDGFRLQGADNQSTGGTGARGAALTLDGGTPIISNNVINGPTESSGVRSVGLVILGPSNDAKGALITNNRILGGSGPAGGAPCDMSMGVLLQSKVWPPASPGAAAEIRSNAIRAGTCNNAAALVSWANADGTLVADNDILAGTGLAGESFGVVVGGSPLGALMIIDGNRINVDQANVGSCATMRWCGGIDSQASKSQITNNVVFGVKGTRSTAAWLRNPEQAPQSLSLNGNYLDGGGMASTPSTMSAAVVLTVNAGTNTTVGRIRNNILAGGTGSARFGVYEESAAGKTCKPEKLENNDFFLTPGVVTDVLYRSWDGAAGAPIPMIAGVNMLSNSAANFVGDPKIDATFHLTAGSPCVDVGTNNEAPAMDLDGEMRPKGNGYDVGADEL